MSLFTKLANDAFSPVDAAGNKRAVENIDAQRWGTEVERLFAAFQAGGGVIFADLAAAGASLEYATNQMAWVIGDSTAANNGIYRKTGASGSGSWVRAGDLPYSMIPLTNAGAGTADAIVATSALPVPVTPGATLFTVNIVAANTGPVTINGKPLRTNSGNEIVPGGLTAGSISAFLDLGDHYRLLSDQASASIVAAAEGWAIQADERADDAENAADRAEGFAAMLSSDKIKFKTVPLLLADEMMSYTADPGKVQVGPGDEFPAQGFRYEVVASGATDHHVETAGGVKLKVLPSGDRMYAAAFGIPGNGSDQTVLLKKLFEAGTGYEIRLGRAQTYLCTDELVLSEGTSLVMRGSALDFACIGGKRLLALDGDDTHVRGGTVRNTLNEAGHQGTYQTPIVVARYDFLYGVKNFSIRDMVVETALEHGNGIAVFGDTHDGVIENIYFPDSATIGIPIMCHWSFNGDWQTNGPKTTVHQRNIKIRNVSTGVLSY